MDKLIDFLFGTLGRLLEPLVDFLTSWVTTVVSLNAQATFKEDKQGRFHQQEGSAVILVVNHGREPIKVDDVGLIFNDGRKLSVALHLTEDGLLPKTVNGKDHAFFVIKRDLLLKLGRAGLYSIKSVYMTNSTFRDFKSRVPKEHKLQIEASLNRRILVR